jgi:hypothetical protein
MTDNFWRAQEIFAAETRANEPTPTQWNEPHALTGHPRVNTGYTDTAVAQRMNAKSRVWDPERYRALRRAYPHITDAHVARATGRDGFVAGGWANGRAQCSATDQAVLEDLFGVEPGYLSREV